MKKGANGKNYGCTMILKSRRVRFVLVLTRRPNMQGYVYLMLDERFMNIFSQVFAFALTIGIASKKKTCPAMDSLVYGEVNGPSFITAEDCVIVYLSTCSFFLI